MEKQMFKFGDLVRHVDDQNMPARVVACVSGDAMMVTGFEGWVPADKFRPAFGTLADTFGWASYERPSSACPGTEAKTTYTSAYVQVAEAPKVDSETARRKAMPVCTGVLDYFPDALLAVSQLSKLGNDKYNPGEPMHHARGKSMDHADALVRHHMQRGTIDPDTGLSHSVGVAWRALAQLQEELERAGAPMARGARKAGT